MQAIEVKFLSRTNHQGARLKAICKSGTITKGWDYSLDDDNYKHVAELLQQKLGWDFTLIEGVLANGNHVFTLT